MAVSGDEAEESAKEEDEGHISYLIQKFVCKKLALNLFIIF